MRKHINEDGTPFSKEQFIDKIKNDKEFSYRFGNLGPVYGKQWRSWKTYKHKMNFEPYLPVNKDGKVECYVEYVDQIANLINDLKTNPDSRRIIISAWNPAEIEDAVLPPCHYGFQVYTRELSEDERLNLFKVDSIDRIDSYNKWLDDNGYPKRAISLMFNMRSADFFLGVPFNIASYGLLLEIIGKMVNMVPEELIGNLGDTHLYSNHIEQAKEQIGQPIFEESPTLYPNGPMNEGIKKQIMVGHTRKPYPLPKLVFGKTDEFFKELGTDLSLLNHLDSSDFKVENYQSHPTIKAPLSN